MPEQTSFAVDGPWIPIRDGNVSALSLFLRHYTAKQTRKISQFVGPGEKLLLLTADARALFAWRAERYRLDGQQGVNNPVFRNEGSDAGSSSSLIRAANEEAWRKWPGERLFTFVDAKKIRHKRDPGRCFIRAGYRQCGESKSGLLIFECLA